MTVSDSCLLQVCSHMLSAARTGAALPGQQRLGQQELGQLYVDWLRQTLPKEVKWEFKPPTLAAA